MKVSSRRSRFTSPRPSDIDDLTTVRDIGAIRRHETIVVRLAFDQFLQIARIEQLPTNEFIGDLLDEPSVPLDDGAGLLVGGLQVGLPVIN